MSRYISYITSVVRRSITDRFESLEGVKNTSCTEETTAKETRSGVILRIRLNSRVRINRILYFHLLLMLESVKLFAARSKIFLLPPAKYTRPAQNPSCEFSINSFSTMKHRTEYSLLYTHRVNISVH